MQNGWRFRSKVGVVELFARAFRAQFDKVQTEYRRSKVNLIRQGGQNLVMYRLTHWNLITGLTGFPQPAKEHLV